jgi:predicted  nucleic acid-binding Zn-ribbon protein
MGQRFLQRRLTQASFRIRELRDELRVVEDQLSHMTDEADDLSLRAMVSETPGASYEYREAKKHADAMSRHRDGLVAEISGLENKINEYLDRMKDSRL